MYTREDLLNKKVTHRAYYAQFVNEWCKDKVVKRFGMERLLEAVEIGPHLNHIPLSEWDELERMMLYTCNWDMLIELEGKPLMAAEERKKSYVRKKVCPWSKSVSVCIAKEAAQQVIEDYKR